MKIVVLKTGRGFSYLQFDDLYKQTCSLQESSLADIEAIWLGVSRDFNGANVNSRMHLTREMVEKLLPYLKDFVEKGDEKDWERINKMESAET